MPKYREEPSNTQGGSSNTHGILLTKISQKKRENVSGFSPQLTGCFTHKNSQTKRENASGFSPPYHRVFYPRKLAEEKGKH
jgi:hypothetical protein